jgi:hypothetical protein
MNSNHRVNVVRIKELRKHPNADSLSLVDIEGYQLWRQPIENWVRWQRDVHGIFN